MEHVWERGSAISLFNRPLHFESLVFIVYVKWISGR